MYPVGQISALCCSTAGFFFGPVLSVTFSWSQFSLIETATVEKLQVSLILAWVLNVKEFIELWTFPVIKGSFLMCLYLFFPLYCRSFAHGFLHSVQLYSQLLRLSPDWSALAKVGCWSDLARLYSNIGAPVVALSYLCNGKNVDYYFFFFLKRKT